MLTISVLIGRPRPQKQSSVTLNFSIEKSSAMRPVVKILYHLSLLMIKSKYISETKLRRFGQNKAKS